MFRWFWRLFVYITRSHRVSLCAQLWREEERRGRTSRRDIERWGRVSNLQRRWEKWPWLLNRTSEHFTCLRHCRLLFPVGGKEHLPSFEYTHINTAHMGHTHTYMNTYEWIHVLSRSRHFIIHNSAPPPTSPPSSIEGGLTTSLSQNVILPTSADGTHNHNDLRLLLWNMKRSVLVMFGPPFQICSIKL